jgi:hypothetical protein
MDDIIFNFKIYQFFGISKKNSWINVSGRSDNAVAGEGE